MSAANTTTLSSSSSEPLGTSGSRDDNRYVELAAFYDNLMTSGYYDYDSFATALHQILDDGGEILDVGIGTGLLTEKLLRLARYDITGIDFSKSMIDQARLRLKGHPVTLVHADIRTYSRERPFDAAISCGGALCISNVLAPSREKGRLRLYSFCDDRQATANLAMHLHGQLRPGGRFAISIQGEHADAALPIRHGITYQQAVSFAPGKLRKTYRFLRGRRLLGEQTISLTYIEEADFLALFAEAGFSYEGVDASANYCIFRKGGSCLNRPRPGP